MKWRTWCPAVVLVAALALPAALAGGPAKATPGKGFKITWKKTVLDRVFRSEGVAVADVNKDGKLDVIAGDVWFEAPNWKMHILRQDKKFDPLNYSESFACFVDDFNGDGWPDVIIIPFPGLPCYWYENPQNRPGPWKKHLLTSSACNETPIYVDLFGKGTRVLVMGWQPPKSKGTEGQMAWFEPGPDPTKPWVMHSISGPSKPKAEVPGTQRFSHGLGTGDVNGDGRMDIICTGGWWEQPANPRELPWKFHSAKLGPNCADMHVMDVDGDGVNDIITSSAHATGLWWHHQRKGAAGSSFARFDFFPHPRDAAMLPKKHDLSPDEVALYLAIGKARNAQGRAPWKMHPQLCALARDLVQSRGEKIKSTYGGKILFDKKFGGPLDMTALTKGLFEDAALQRGPLGVPGLEIGVAVQRTANGEIQAAVVLGDRQLYVQFGQSHALHLVDINGDGLKDLVTGRRWWAHGPRGDEFPSDPAYLYWFEAVRRGGQITFIPHLIDDDSGIGTQFAVADINGDGLLDIIISNKKGTFVFEQVRTKED